MLLYQALARNAYGLPVESAVVYMGEQPMSMEKEIRENNLSFRYLLIDLKDIEPAEFLESDAPEEIILAVLMGREKGEEKRWLVRRILIKLRSLLPEDAGELSRRIAQLEVLGELRGVQQIIFEEEQNMPITYNLEKDLRYNQGLEKGLEKGMEKGMEKGLVKGLKKGLEQSQRSVVVNLLQQTDFTDEKIAAIAQVSLEFVAGLRKSLPQS